MVPMDRRFPRARLKVPVIQPPLDETLVCGLTRQRVRAFRCVQNGDIWCNPLSARNNQ